MLLFTSQLWWCYLLILLPILCRAQDDQESADAGTSHFETTRSEESVLGEGEEVSGRSSSSFSTFRRFRLVCDASFAEYQSLLRHEELSDIYRDFKTDLNEKRKEHFFHTKIVPSKLKLKCSIESLAVIRM